jgi:hypothetical protein
MTLTTASAACEHGYGIGGAVYRRTFNLKSRVKSIILEKKQGQAGRGPSVCHYNSQSKHLMAF